MYIAKFKPNEVLFLVLYNKTYKPWFQVNPEYSTGISILFYKNYLNISRLLFFHPVTENAELYNKQDSVF
jgi:hypothetical protein